MMMGLRHGEAAEPIPPWLHDLMDYDWVLDEALFISAEESNIDSDVGSAESEVEPELSLWYDDLHGHDWNQDSDDFDYNQ
jgi:hypothetical protein